jgi:hypothetical protein
MYIRGWPYCVSALLLASNDEKVIILILGDRVTLHVSKVPNRVDCVFQNWAIVLGYVVR